MPRAFAVLAFLTCSAFLFAQSPGGYTAELDVRAVAARVAVERAGRALETGDPEGALAAADEGRALDPLNGDARYLYALCLVRLAKPLPEAEADLRVALSSGRFRQYSADDTARLLAHILIHTKRYAQALPLTSRPGLSADSDALYLRAKALRFLGDTESFLAAVDAGLDRYPADARMVRELLAFAAGTPRTEAIALRVRRVEARLGFYRYLDPELLGMLVPFRYSETERRDLLLEYRALGKKNPHAVLQALDLGILDDGAAVAEFFSFPALTWNDIRGLRALLRDDAGRAAFSEAFSRYSGNIGYDSNGDGVYESMTVYRQGQIDSWSLDFDQDGVLEVSFKFRENLPDSGKMVLSGADLYLEYGDYPNLAKARFSTREGQREYLFSPDALAFPVVELSLEANGKNGNEYAPSRTERSAPSDAACAMAAYRITDRPSEKAASIRVTDMDRGIPVRGLVRTADGRSGILVYRNGHPFRELADMDGDGLFESRYIYDFEPGGESNSEFSPVRFEADLNLDGVYEYVEDLASPYVRTWDYDGDGRVDARTESLKDGGELWEFSRRFDGRLDTDIVVRNGRIARVLRGGVEIPLTPDSGGKVLWVGAKLFDFGSSIPAPGSGKRGGLRYRVVRFGAQLLAEAVP